jgi:hypothetical protein
MRLGSTQAPILQAEIDLLKEHIAKAGSHSLSALIVPLVLTGLIVIALLIGLIRLLKFIFRQRTTAN